MTDSKNIVIKVKYTAPDTAEGSSSSQPRMITEWNIKRITVALILVVLLIMAAVFLLSNHSDDTEGERNPAVPPATSTSEAEPQDASDTRSSTLGAPTVTAKPSQSSPVPVETSPSSRVRRASLAYRIIDKEPADLIGSIVNIDKGKPVLVHYFTEVRGKAHQTLFHEWRKDGQIILRHPMLIEAERWRTSSKRQMNSDDQGLWSVRTVDDQGSIMNEMSFSVSAK